jgi:hypothetical protein
MRNYGWDLKINIGHAFGYVVAPYAAATCYASLPRADVEITDPAVIPLAI